MKRLVFSKYLYSTKLRVAWIILLCLLVFVFIFLKIVPGGEISYRKNYQNLIGSGQGFVYNFTPQERVDESERLPKIIGDPVYFSVFTPRNFSKAKLSIIYKNNLSEKAPIIEAGVLADSLVWRYDLKPLENKIIDNVKTRDPWFVLSSSNPLILQKNNNYSSKEDFLSDLNNNNLKGCENDSSLCTAFYNYNFEKNYEKLSFDTPKRSFSLEVPLRGAHNLLIYINESINLDVDFVDLNLDKKADPISLILSKSGALIAQSKLIDPNLKPESKEEELKSLSLEASDLDTGIYSLEIKISDDVVIKEINSSTNRLVFSRKLWPVSWGKDLDLYTTSSYLKVKALGPASLQNINFGEQNFYLDEPYAQKHFALSNPSNINKIEISKDDVILENDGIFSFSEDIIFSREVNKINANFQEIEKMDYIVANYKSPVIKEDGFKKASATFDLRGVYREDGKYNFMISIPEINKQNYNDNVVIKEVRIDFSGTTWWQKIVKLFK